MALTDHKSRGLLRFLLRAPIWLYRARLGRLVDTYQWPEVAAAVHAIAFTSNPCQPVSIPGRPGEGMRRGPIRWALATVDGPANA